MKKIKAFFRNLARKFFQKWIKIYQNQYFISDLDILERKYEAERKEAIKWEIAKSFAEKMLEDNLIEFEEEFDPKTGGRIIRSKIRII